MLSVGDDVDENWGLLKTKSNRCLKTSFEKDESGGASESDDGSGGHAAAKKEEGAHDDGGHEEAGHGVDSPEAVVCSSYNLFTCLFF